jgi:hypothetical protein
MPIERRVVPIDSLLQTFRGGRHPERWGQGDCFSVVVGRPVTLGEFVVAFHTSPVFRVERFISISGPRWPGAGIEGPES